MKQLAKSYLLLVVLQGMNFLIPLAIFPYLSNKLGLEIFGVVIFAQSLALLIGTITEFGFSLSATKEVALNSEDTHELGNILSSVFTIKISLMFICLFVYILSIFTIDKLVENSDIFLYSFLIVVGQLLIPSWLFIGLNKAKHYVGIRLVSQLVTMFIIFLLVNDSEDYLIVPIAYALGGIVGTILSIFVIYNIYKIKLSIQSRSRVFITLKNSSHYFLSRLFNDGSQYFVITLLGFVFRSEVVAYYAVAEKFYVAINGIFSPLSQIIYPYMVKTRNIANFKKILALVSIVLLSMVLLLFINVDSLVALLSGEINDGVSNLSRLMILASGISVFSVLIGYPLLGAFDYQKNVNDSVIIGSVFYVLLVLISVYIFKSLVYVILSFIAYEAFVLFFRLYFVNKTKILMQ